ncbi:MAG TPA: VOC family protein [Streptosporangiaceae bacterium]|nr:VOC family protein [Streptosporangiaceae bacterium]
MPFDFQIAVDASQPHVLADWWAETLGWVVEPSSEAFIRKMIAEGYATDDDTMTHNGALVWREGAAIRHPDEVAGGGTRPRILFQLVPESKTVKNRWHLDIRVGAESIDAQVAALTERGASYLHKASQGPHWWVTMADPEGNEFCVS